LRLGGAGERAIPCDVKFVEGGAKSYPSMFYPTVVYNNNFARSAAVEDVCDPTECHYSSLFYLQLAAVSSVLERYDTIEYRGIFHGTCRGAQSSVPPNTNTAHPSSS